MRTDNSLDLINANGLENYYGGEGSVDYGKMAEQSATLMQSLINLKKPKSQIEQEIKGACGRKPLVNFPNKQKDKWEKCKNTLLSTKEAEAKKQQEPIYAPPQKDTPPPKDDTILGIPKTGFYVGLTVLVLVGGFVTYKLITRNKNK